MVCGTCSWQALSAGEWTELNVCSAPDLQGIADGRVNLIGRMAPITDDAEKAAAKAAYLSKHPNSFWVEFGDFRCGQGLGLWPWGGVLGVTLIWRGLAV